MTDAECVVLLNYLREQVRGQRQYADADAVIASEVGGLSGARNRLEAYLKMLIGALRERSDVRAIDIDARFRGIFSGTGNSYEGLVVQLSGSEQEQYGLSEFTLHDLDDAGAGIDELTSLLEDLRSEPKESGPQL